MLQQENAFPVPDEKIDQNATYLRFLGPTPDSAGELKTLEISIQLIMPCYTKTNKQKQQKTFLPDTWGCHLVSWYIPTFPSCFPPDIVGKALLRSRLTPSITEVMLQDLNPPCNNSSWNGSVCSVLLCSGQLTRVRGHGWDQAWKCSLQLFSVPFGGDNHTRLCSCHYSWAFP